MNAKIKIKRLSGSEFTESDLLSFSFTKDAYLPYTTLSAQIYAGSENEDYLSISEVSLYIDDKQVHHGLIDSLEFTELNRRKIVTLSSRGFTSLLCQNQIAPGMITNISINKLMDSYYTLPYVTHEDNSDQSNYIFVKNTSSMWDGIVSLAYKLSGTYPYISGTNCVRITKVAQPSSFSYNNNNLLDTGLSHNYKRMISNFHMADIAGDFGTYELQDSAVVSRKIVRHKFFELDKEFLYNPNEALVFRDKIAKRAMLRRFCRYCGYSGEDLSDVVSFNNVVAKRISRIEVNGNSHGIFTELSVYYDGFSPAGT